MTALPKCAADLGREGLLFLVARFAPQVTARELAWARQHELRLAADRHFAAYRAACDEEDGAFKAQMAARPDSVKHARLGVAHAAAKRRRCRAWEAYIRADSAANDIFGALTAPTGGVA